MGKNIIDQYSLLHFAAGIVVYFWGMSLETWFILHLLFEIIENTSQGIYFINHYFKNIWPGGKPYPDNYINIISDNVFAVLGWLIAYFMDYYGNKYGLYEGHLTNKNKLQLN